MNRRSNRFFTETFSQKLRLIALFCLFSAAVSAQDLPGKIRGYKVYRADISVKTIGDEKQTKSKSEAFVKIGEPKLIEVSLTGITFELSAEIDAFEQSGKIDFLAFNDFRVNGLSVEIEEYKETFEFKKNQPITLPKPARIFLDTTQALRGALKELNDPKEEWLVTGRVFVFGKFKKYGISFKRVVPVGINIKIKNPLRQIAASNRFRNETNCSI